MNTKKIRIPNRFDSSVTCWEGEVEDTGSDAKNLGTATLKALAEKADLRFADLRSADLRSADLRFANLGSADLRFADLRSADLRFANLRFADLRSADLRSADLRFANLRSADLRFADLRFADLGSANLGSADLRSADLGSAHIAKAKIRRILQIGPIGSRDSMLVVWIMEAGDFRYSTGCQNQITEEAFRERVVASHGGNEHGRAYMEAIEFAHRLAGIYAPAAVVAE
jgi:hypothetical protein